MPPSTPTPIAADLSKTQSPSRWKQISILIAAAVLFLMLAWTSYAYFKPSKPVASQAPPAVEQDSLATTSAPTQMPQYASYRDSAEGYSIQFPLGWNAFPPLYADSGSVASWDSPERDSYLQKGIKVPFIAVAIKKLSTSDSNALIAQEVANFKKGATVISESSTTVDGELAARLEITHDLVQENTTVKNQILMQWTYHNGNLYLVRTEASPSEWDTYGPLYTAIQDSFSFTK